MVSRSIVFSKKNIEQIPANELEQGQKGLRISTKGMFCFKPTRLNEPEKN